MIMRLKIAIKNNWSSTRFKHAKLDCSATPASRSVRGEAVQLGVQHGVEHALELAARDAQRQIQPVEARAVKFKNNVSNSLLHANLEIKTY